MQPITALKFHQNPFKSCKLTFTCEMVETHGKKNRDEYIEYKYEA